MALAFILESYVIRLGQETYVFNREGKIKSLYLKYQDEHYTCLHRGLLQKWHQHSFQCHLESVHLEGGGASAGATARKEAMLSQPRCS